MNPNTLKSVGAVVAGLAFIVVTHSATDAILESKGVLPKGHLNAGAGLILFVIAYRAIFSFGGCYLTARLAPTNPLKHAFILGAIGTVLSAAGAIATASMNLAPSWYAWSLVITALPIAWVAGKFYVSSGAKKLVAR